MPRATFTRPTFVATESLLLVEEAMGWTTAGAHDVRIGHAMTAAALYACSLRNWSWLRNTAYFQTRTLTLKTVANSGATRTANVAELTLTATAHGLEPGQTVKVVDCSDSTFDGIHTVVKSDPPAATTIQYMNPGTNVGAAAAGTGSLYVMSYPLQSIDETGAITATDTSLASFPYPDAALEKVAWPCKSVDKVYYDDDYTLQLISWAQYRRLERLSNQGASKPTQYALRSRLSATTTESGSVPVLHLWPAPADAYDIYLDYTMQHSQIVVTATTGTDDRLYIIPDYAQFGVYIQGTAWLLRHEFESIGSLMNCPGFADAVAMMHDNEPEARPDHPINRNQDAVGRWPQDARVIEGHISDEMSL